MTDRLTPEQRHLVMSHIHGKGTKPELKVRQWLWHHGYRYRLNVKSVPGKPDIVMRKYHTAIFVNGCFWHGHHVEVRGERLELRGEESTCCKIPETNQTFWVNKIKRNQERDQKNYQVLHDNGWQVIVVWECELKPKYIEETMNRVELQLNDYFLKLHSHKHIPFTYHQETEVPLAAEEINYPQGSSKRD